MSKLNEDGNIIGRVGAIALLVAAGFGFHRLNCSGGMCPVVKTDSCCAGAMGHEKAEAPAPVPAPSNPAK